MCEGCCKDHVTGRAQALLQLGLPAGLSVSIARHACWLITRADLQSWYTVDVADCQDSHLCIVAEQQAALQRVLAVCDKRCGCRDLLQSCICLKGGESGLVVWPQGVQG